MVKIRLRRVGTKGRPFYRVVVAKSTAGRNGAFIETIGTYDPVVTPTAIKLDEGRAMHWLMQGAQPTETAARIFSKTGLLERFFAERPTAKKAYAFLDKRTAATSKRSVMDKPEKAATPKEEAAAVPAEEPQATAEPETAAPEAADEAPPAEPAEEVPAEAQAESEPAAEEPEPPAESGDAEEAKKEAE